MTTAAGLSVHEAAMVFARHGVDVHGLEPHALRLRWLQLARQFHTAGGLDHQATMAEINAAYDALRHGWKPTPGVANHADPRRDGACIWAWAGFQGRGRPDDRIERADDRDPNFVKRRIWELSGRVKEEWTIWPFDGRRFLASLTVYGTRAQFPEMARAALLFARVGFRSPQAVFVQRAQDAWGKCYLIYINGRFPDAVPFDHQGGNSPALDRLFVEALPTRLLRLMR